MPVPDATGATVERMDTMLDALATANRAAIRNTQEIATLRMTLTLALIVGFAIYIHHTKGRK